MAAIDQEDESESTKLYPAVAMYCPKNVRDLKKGEVKLWCACGLSKKQPWCDGSHKGTGIKPLKWTVPHKQSLYQLCNCKYTSKPPYCDGSHTSLPERVLPRVKSCSQTDTQHKEDCKLCTSCGWVPDF